MASLTLRVSPEDFQKLREILLERGLYEIEASGILYALTDGSNFLRFYPSGTILLQGRDAQSIKELLLSLIDVPPDTMVGCDESGKGDVFGPLVLCCAVIKPEYYREVLSLNMRDCKKMKDEEVLRKAEAFASSGEFLCRTLEPLQLNELYSRLGNLNRILDGLYGELLQELFRKYPSANFYVDAYSHRNPFGGRVHFQHRGEENLAVATASVLARAEFLRWLKRHHLPKGSSREAIELARRMYLKNPQEAKGLLKTFFL